MACDYFLGDPDGCPVCGGKPLVPCPDCEDGYRYYIIDPDTEDRRVAGKLNKYLKQKNKNYDKRERIERPHPGGVG